jgi:hypothetical protein
LLKQDTAPRGGLLDMIPGLQDLPDTTRILIGAVVMLVAVAGGILVYFLITRA